MREVSHAAMRLLAGIVADRFQGPRILFDAWAAGAVSNEDLRQLIPDTWLYVDWIIGARKWVQMFRAAGFLSIPYGLPAPDRPLTVFRGASLERQSGMSWTPDINRADQFRQRHSLVRAVGHLPDSRPALSRARPDGTPGRVPARGRSRPHDARGRRSTGNRSPAAPTKRRMTCSPGSPGERQA